VLKQVELSRGFSKSGGKVNMGRRGTLFQTRGTKLQMKKKEGPAKKGRRTATRWVKKR